VPACRKRLLSKGFDEGNATLEHEDEMKILAKLRDIDISRAKKTKTD
jgi:hypothetical protein